MNSHTVHGGLKLEAHKQRSTAHGIRQAAAPANAVLPLDQHSGKPAVPIVTVNETVALGQPIARPGGEPSAWLHAPVSGTVVAIEPRASATWPDAMVMSIVIANDGAQRPFETSALDYRAVSRIELCAHLARGGIVGLGGAVFPADVKLLRSGMQEKLHLLLNGAECEPYISCDDMLMRERADDVVLGGQILRHAANAQRCTIALENDTPQAEAAIRAAIKRSGDGDIDVAIVPNIYPAGGERQLITAVFGTEVPHGGLPADVGVVCHNVGTAAAAARWLRDGQPLLSRIVTVTGMGVREPGNFEARLGTPISQLIGECGGYTGEAVRLLMGGSMMGVTLPHDDVAVVKAMNCIVAAAPADLRPRGPEMPCIRCSNCSEVCPARLMPQQLHWFLQPADLGELQRYGLLDCIECGCCDYVCPSQIPLASRFAAAKPVLAAAITAREQAAASREHFEARNERLARLESQRRAKLEAKRQQVKNEKP